MFQQLDLAEPVNYVDPKGGGDYFTAGTQMSKASDQLNGSCLYCSDGTFQHISDIPYFEDVFPQMKGYDFDGESATDAIYNNEWATQRYSYGETGAIYDIDFGCFYGGYCETDGPKFWNSQFSSLIALSSIGMSYYNAAQLTLRHPAERLDDGLQLHVLQVDRYGFGCGTVADFLRRNSECLESRR